MPRTDSSFVGCLDSMHRLYDDAVSYYPELDVFRCCRPLAMH